MYAIHFEQIEREGPPEEASACVRSGDARSLRADFGERSVGGTAAAGDLVHAAGNDSARVGA